MFPTYVGLSHERASVSIKSIPVSLSGRICSDAINKLKLVKSATQPNFRVFFLFNFLLKEEALEYLILLKS